MRMLDLTQDFSVHTPAFASYDGPSVKWVKRLAFDRAGGQEITTTLHVSTHLDAPAHFFSGGKFIGDLPRVPTVLRFQCNTIVAGLATDSGAIHPGRGHARRAARSGRP